MTEECKISPINRNLVITSNLGQSVGWLNQAKDAGAIAAKCSVIHSSTGSGVDQQAEAARVRAVETLKRGSAGRF